MAPYPSSGDQVGPYRIDNPLGEGEHSVVYAARQVLDECPVALRVMSPEDSMTRRRLSAAARDAVSVDSPHVARVRFYGQAGPHLFVASELVAQGSLSRLLDHQGPAPVAAGLEVMAQVASGLAAVHDRGLVHGALTPANVLVQWRGDRLVALLGDVGFGRADTAPEVHLGAGRSVASDVHSLGALTWTVLTGEPPHAGTPYLVAHAFVHQPTPQLLGHSPRAARLNALLARAMHHDPAQRHTCALELRDDLLAALALPGEAGPLTRAPVRSSRPHPHTMRATALLCAGLMSVGAVTGTALLASSF